MNSICTGFGFFVALFLATPSQAEGPAPLAVSKVDFYFEPRIDVQMKGKVAKADDSSLIGANASFTQTLTFVGKASREEQRTFDTPAALERWIETEVCAEIHEVDAKPIKQNGVRGEQSFRARLKPLMVKVSGKELSKPERALNQHVVCKRNPKSSENRE